MDFVVEAIKSAVIEIDEAILNFDFFERDNFDEDVNGIIVKHFSKVDSIKYVARKKDKKEIKIDENGKFIVTYIDIDDMDNTKINWSFGSLFIVYENSISKDNIKEVIYAVYGPRTELVITKDAPEVFILESNKTFTSKKFVTMEEKGKIVSFGSYLFKIDKKYENIVNSLLNEGYRLRHSHSLIMDINFIFLKHGGLLFLDPTKLDPIFDLFGFEYLFEKAGTNRLENSIDYPIFFGSNYEVDKVKELRS